MGSFATAIRTSSAKASLVSMSGASISVEAAEHLCLMRGLRAVLHGLTAVPRIQDDVIFVLQSCSCGMVLGMAGIA